MARSNGAHAGRTYQAQSIATPIRAKMEYSIHENGAPSSYVEPASVPESSSANGSYSSALAFADTKKALIRSIFANISSNRPCCVFDDRYGGERYGWTILFSMARTRCVGGQKADTAG
jgi:hypothetical protein